MKKKRNDCQACLQAGIDIINSNVDAAIMHRKILELECGKAVWKRIVGIAKYIGRENTNG